jgi:hypothetical protein
MSRSPSTALLLAQALAAENRDTWEDMTTERRSIRAFWRERSPVQRRHWLRKAKRVLERMQAVGPGGSL